MYVFLIDINNYHKQNKILITIFARNDYLLTKNVIKNNSLSSQLVDKYIKYISLHLYCNE